MTEDERMLIAWTRLMAKAAGGGIYALLLDQGRLFTPSSTPIARSSLRGDCFRAASLSNWPETVVVEGLALRSDTGAIGIEHAWRAADTVALDATWPDGLAYLGLPLVETFRRHRQDHGYWSVLWSPASRDLMQGLPATALVPIGRPLHAEAAD